MRSDTAAGTCAALRADLAGIAVLVPVRRQHQDGVLQRRRNTVGRRAEAGGEIDFYAVRGQSRNGRDRIVPDEASGSRCEIDEIALRRDDHCNAGVVHDAHVIN